MPWSKRRAAALPFTRCCTEGSGVRGDRWLFLSTLAGAGISGLLYGGVRCFGVRMGEFGPEPHPWQGLLQHSHLWLAPPLVFALGWMIRGHALEHLRRKAPRWRSGWFLLLLAMPLVFSGIGIQTSVEPKVQILFRWMHGIGGGLFLLVVFAHLWKRRRP